MRTGEVAEDGDAVGVMLSNRHGRVWLLPRAYQHTVGGPVRHEEYGAETTRPGLYAKPWSRLQPLRQLA